MKDLVYRFAFTLFCMPVLIVIVGTPLLELVRRGKIKYVTEDLLVKIAVAAAAVMLTLIIVGLFVIAIGAVIESI